MSMIIQSNSEISKPLEIINFYTNYIVDSFPSRPTILPLIQLSTVSVLVNKKDTNVGKGLEIIIYIENKVVKFNFNLKIL